MIKLSIRDSEKLWLTVHDDIGTAISTLAKGVAYTLKAISAHSGQPLKSLAADFILQVITLIDEDKGEDKDDDSDDGKKPRPPP